MYSYAFQLAGLKNYVHITKVMNLKKTADLVS